MTEEAKTPEAPVEAPVEPVAHKGRGGARPGAGRKAKWGEKTVVMRVPQSLRADVEAYVGLRAQGVELVPAGEMGALPGEDAAAELQAMREQLERARQEAAEAREQAERAERQAAEVCEQLSRAQAEAADAREQAEQAQRDAAASCEDLARAQEEAAEAREQLGRVQAEVAEAREQVHASQAGASSAFAPAPEPAQPALVVETPLVSAQPEPAPTSALAPEKTKKSRAPRRKAAPKAGAVDPERQGSLFDLL